jgi:hypothetical protein
VIGAVEWVIDWVERQSTAMKARFRHVVGCSRHNGVAAIYAWLR